MTDKRKEGVGILGIGAAACIACCAPLILAFHGGLSLAGLASTLVIGTFGLLVFAAAGAGYLFVVRRRRRSACAVSPAEPVPVDTPTRKVSM